MLSPLTLARQCVPDSVTSEAPDECEEELLDAEDMGGPLMGER